MTSHNPQDSIEDIVNEAIAVFKTAEGIPGLLDTSSSGYRTFFEKIPEYILSDKLKIAVVGVIKSGKSTFVNSLLGKELVKRGAGVVTSITTRIQKGKKNQAHLYLRSWDDINAELRNLLVRVPDDDVLKGFREDFDIRRKNDRGNLGKSYQKILKAYPRDQDIIPPEILSIRHALQGFDALKDLVQPDETVICFESQEFEKYKDYTSDPDKAFYIRDVCLSAPMKSLDPHIEIADCQGADSTDPSQLSRILTYLELSNLMIYCISSRTGLRESDMVFLKRIKNMGLLDNVLFINNCDLTEHETLEDLLKIEAGICEGLSMLEVKPDIYSFSVLYNLFLNIKSRISKKDLFRLESWQKEKKMVQYCDLKTNEFNLRFNQMIEKNRHELIFSNHMKRLFTLLSDLKLRIQNFLDLLSSDKAKEEKARKAASDFYQKAYRFEAIVSDSLKNSVQGLKKEIDISVHQMFFQDKDAVLRDIHEYVQMLSIDIESHQFHGRGAGFNEVLSLIFKEFHRRVDRYGIEAVKPLLEKFINLQEERIKSFFHSLAESYHIHLLPSDQYLDLKDRLLSDHEKMVPLDVADMGEIKKILGIQLPYRVFEVQYTPGIKARVMTGFGLKTLSQFFPSLFGKQSEFSFAPALKKAAGKIKIENQGIFRKQFEQYGTDLKTQYFLPLIDAATRDFKEKTNERLRQYQSLNTKGDEVFFLKQLEKEDQKLMVLSLKQRIEGLIDSIEAFTAF